MPAGNTFIQLFAMEILRNPWAVKRSLRCNRSSCNSCICGSNIELSEWIRNSRSMHRSSGERLRSLVNTSELTEREPNSSCCQRQDDCIMASKSGGLEAGSPACIIVIAKGQAVESLNHLCTSSMCASIRHTPSRTYGRFSRG